MIGNKLEQSIINVFQSNLDRTFSINEVAKKLNKSYPIINKKSNFFLKEGVLKKINIGKSYQCFLNLDNDKTKILMSINELNTAEQFLTKNSSFQNSYLYIKKLCGDQKLGKYISLVCIHNRDIFFVLIDSDLKIISELKNSLSLNSGFSVKFLSELEFKEEFLKNSDLQKNHIIIFDVHSYLKILNSLSEKLLVQGMLRDIHNSNLKDDFILIKNGKK